jgi:hypothetical protein
MYLYLKWGIRNTKFQLINQHKNDVLGSFDCDFTHMYWILWKNVVNFDSKHPLMVKNVQICNHGLKKKCTFDYNLGPHAKYIFIIIIWVMFGHNIYI